MLSVSVLPLKSHALARLLSSARQPRQLTAGRREMSRGDTSLRLTSPSPISQQPSPSALASPCALAVQLPSNPWLALGSSLALHPAQSSDAGVTLIRWVPICSGGGGRGMRDGGRGEGRRRSSPCESRSPQLCIPEELTTAARTLDSERRPEENFAPPGSHCLRSGGMVGLFVLQSEL